MAIDTVIVRSPGLSCGQAEQIKKLSVRKMAVDLERGDLLYQFTSSQLQGSYDYRIRVNVKEDDWCYNDVKNTVVKVDCRPYLEVECSVHKLLLGHNVCGGTDDLYRSIKYLVDLLEKYFKIKLPEFHLWRLKKIDLAEVYRLPSLESCMLYVKGLQQAKYPRRTPYAYSTSIMWAGSTSAIKFYCKGPEYRKHDKARLKKYFGFSAEQLQDLADCILRCEVAIKSRKIIDIFGEYPVISDVNMGKLYNVYDDEVNKVLQNGGDGVAKYRLACDVEKVLYREFSTRKARALLATWYQLSAMGYDHTKTVMNPRTLRDHIQNMREKGITWQGSDVKIDYTKASSVIPIDFVANRSSSYRLNFVAPEITRKLGEIELLKAE